MEAWREGHFLSSICWALHIILCARQAQDPENTVLHEANSRMSPIRTTQLLTPRLGVGEQGCLRNRAILKNCMQNVVLLRNAENQGLEVPVYSLG